MKIRALPKKDKDTIVVDVRFVMTKIELNDLSSDLLYLTSTMRCVSYIPTLHEVGTAVANAAHNNLPEWSKEDED